MRKLIAVSAAVGLAAASFAAAPVAGASTSAAAARAGSISWGACSDPGLQAAGAVCGYLSVPLDYSKPSGAKIKLALSMVRHTSP